MERKLTKQQKREMISREFMERHNLKPTIENFKAMRNTFLEHELKTLWAEARVK